VVEGNRQALRADFAVELDDPSLTVRNRTLDLHGRRAMNPRHPVVRVRELSDLKPDYGRSLADQMRRRYDPTVDEQIPDELVELVASSGPNRPKCLG
jgi:hypothetical protein